MMVSSYICIATAINSDIIPTTLWEKKIKYAALRDIKLVTVDPAKQNSMNSFI